MWSKCGVNCIIEHPLYIKKTFSKAAVCKFSIKVGLLKNVAKYTGKHLCFSLFFSINKSAGSKRVTLLQRNSGASVFL